MQKLIFNMSLIVILSVYGSVMDVHAAAPSAPYRSTVRRQKSVHWQARWIMAPAPPTDAVLRNLSWVWLPGSGINAQPGAVCFRKSIFLPRGEILRAARFEITADNAFKLYINGQFAGKGQNWHYLHSIAAASMLRTGRNTIAIKAINGGTSPNPAGLIGFLAIRWADGHRRMIPIDTSWKISGQTSVGWKGTTFNDASWTFARAIARWGQQPWGRVMENTAPLPIFRRSFALGKKVAQASVCVSGLGQYDLFINGKRVGDDLLQPGWTDYRKSVLYNTYQVTKMLHSGRNAMGVMLGTGMYDSALYAGRYNHAPASFGLPKLILQLHITFADGTATTIISNSAWRTAAGPITFCNIYGGEDYNAQAAVPGWDKPTFNATHWQHAIETHGPGGVLTSQIAPPVKVMHTYKTVRITHPQPGVLVYDLGQNMAGRPVITARGPAGSSFTVYPSELLHRNGTEWQSCAGPIWCTYTLNGKGVETFHPIFSYFGFRYVQINGATTDANNPGQMPVILSVVGQATHTSSPTIGHFSCSNPLLNEIHHLITMAMVNNMVSIITDCPTREKTGWLEDTYLVGPGIMDNYFVPKLYEQTAANMRDAQRPDGMVPDFAPAYFNYSGGFINSPEWGSACVLDPWLTYKYFGNKRILSRNYHMMVRYLDYLKSRAKNNIIAFGLGDWYDLGPRAPGVEQLTSLGVTATATWYRDLTTMVKISRLLGHRHAGKRYAAQAATVRAAFNRKFYHPASGQYDRGSQCANAMALATGLVQRADRQKVLANLIANIRKHGDHTTAGDIGFHYVVQALTNAGQAALLYQMATQTSPPSYGYQIAHGATALTEAWDALPQDSQDHFMLGDMEQWFFNGLGGIRINMASKPGHQLEIRPAIVGKLKWVKVSYDSVLGDIVSHWHHSGNHLTMHIIIPPNVTARIYIPTRHGAAVQLNGKPLAAALAALGEKAAHPVIVIPGVVMCRLPAGDYHIHSLF
jgi:hypothetical protein